MAAHSSTRIRTHTHLQGDIEWGYLHYSGQFDTPTGYMPFTKGVNF